MELADLVSSCVLGCSLPCSCRGPGLVQTGWLSLNSVQLLPSLGSHLPGLWPGWITCPWIGGIALWGSHCQGGFMPSCPASDGPQQGGCPLQTQLYSGL